MYHYSGSLQICMRIQEVFFHVHQVSFLTLFIRLLSKIAISTQ
ncbi:hypothetical protein bcgnr5380_27080 [Bacillus cereus]